MSARADGRQYPAFAVRDLVARGREVNEGVRECEQTGARFVLTRYGVPVVALVPLRDLDVLAALDRAEGYSLDELRKIADVRTTPAPDGAEENPR